MAWRAGQGMRYRVPATESDTVISRHGCSHGYSLRKHGPGPLVNLNRELGGVAVHVSFLQDGTAVEQAGFSSSEDR